MRIYGIDFTSAPRTAKPIVCAEGQLDGRRLEIERLTSWKSFEGFEELLISAGPWLAGVDFPLGQPAELARLLGWPADWQAYVMAVGEMDRQAFVQRLEAFSKSQPAGRKHLFRKTDRVSAACSPMMIYGVPVAKMFFEGAPRIARTSINVVPCRRTDDDRSLVETYPALVARHLIGKTSYKADSRKNNTLDRQSSRAKLVDRVATLGLVDSDAPADIRLELSDTLRDACVEDMTGDLIDSVICCLLAAWCFLQPDGGLPETVDPNEGWIVNPFQRE